MTLPAKPDTRPANSNFSSDLVPSDPAGRYQCCRAVLGRSHRSNEGKPESSLSLTKPVMFSVSRTITGLALWQLRYWRR